jgi:DNA-binding Lrp family transcriptional regulator
MVSKTEFNDRRVLKALEGNPMSQAELGKFLDLSDAGIWLIVRRLCESGRIRKIEEKRRVGARGQVSVLYELGDAEDVVDEMPKRRLDVASVLASLSSVGLEVAGVFRIAALQSVMTANERGKSMPSPSAHKGIARRKAA